MATLPKVLINRADYQIGGGVALGLRTQGGRADEVAVLGAESVLSPGAVDEQAHRMISADLRSLI
jgi:hypothetical protein